MSCTSIVVSFVSIVHLSFLLCYRLFACCKSVRLCGRGRWCGLLCVCLHQHIHNRYTLAYNITPTLLPLLLVLPSHCTAPHTNHTKDKQTESQPPLVVALSVYVIYNSSFTPAILCTHTVDSQSTTLSTCMAAPANPAYLQNTSHSRLTLSFFHSLTSWTWRAV